MTAARSRGRGGRGRAVHARASAAPREAAPVLPRTRAPGGRWRAATRRPRRGRGARLRAWSASGPAACAVVRGVGDELALRAERRVKAAEEIVDRVRQFTQVVIRLPDRQPLVQVRGGDPLRCRGDPPQRRSARPAANQPSAIDTTAMIPSAMPEYSSRASFSAALAVPAIRVSLGLQRVCGRQCREFAAALPERPPRPALVVDTKMPSVAWLTSPYVMASRAPPRRRGTARRTAR